MFSLLHVFDMGFILIGPTAVWRCPLAPTTSVAILIPSTLTRCFHPKARIMHLNVQSLLPKFDLTGTETDRYDIAVFNENWLKLNISGDDIMFDYVC